jgi:hypothetical protein
MHVVIAARHHVRPFRLQHSHLEGASAANRRRQGSGLALLDNVDDTNDPSRRKGHCLRRNPRSRPGSSAVPQRLSLRDGGPEAGSQRRLAAE